MIKFAIYTFLGFILESLYLSILNKKIIFSGLLKGPCIPIYGFGATLILNTSIYCHNNIDIFFYSLICCSTLEYLTHYFLLKDSKIQIWNYSKLPHNYSARICMFYSIIWGLLGIFLVNYIDPFINNILLHLNYNFLNILALIYFIFILYQFYTNNYKS